MKEDVLAAFESISQAHTTLDVAEEILRQKLHAWRSTTTLRAIAQELGVSAAHVNDVLHSRRRLSRRLADRITMRRTMAIGA